MAATNLDRLLAALVVQLHPSSVCTIGQGWRLAFAPLEAVTVHHVLAGTGIVRVGNSTPKSYAPGSIIIVPPRQGHVIGDAGPLAGEVDAGDHCGPFADGLVAFKAGDGSGTLLLCGSIPAPHGRAFSLLDALPETVAEVQADAVGHGAFDLMRSELAAPGLGTVAIAEALMKTCLVALLRGRFRLEGDGQTSSSLPGDPRLTRAVLAVLENPGAPHTVADLADHVGMSRASFADHFSRAMGSGPMEFVQAVRLRAATRLLENTSLPVKTVAAAVGYTDPNSFSRAFRGAYGMDPTVYRNRAVASSHNTLEAYPGSIPCATTVHEADTDFEPFDR